MRIILALIFLSQFYAACTDSSGGGGAATMNHGGSTDTVLWTQDDIDDERTSCIDGNSQAFGSKAPIWCLCIIETASKRWSHEDFIKTPIEKFETLAKDGTGARCNTLAGFGEWTVADLTSARSDCVNSAININQSLASKRESVGVSCGCLLEDASKRWAYDDYLKNQYSYSQQQMNDGIVKKCLEFAGLISNQNGQQGSGQSAGGGTNTGGTNAQLPFQGETWDVVINGGAAKADTRNVILSITAPPSAKKMKVASNSYFTGAIWEDIQTTKGFVFPGNGIQSVYVKFKDSNNNETTSYANAAIEIVPFTTTNGGIFLSNGTATSVTRTVSFNITVPPAATYMITSNSSSFAGASWKQSASSDVIVFPGEGNFTAYLKFKDDVGQESGVFSRNFQVSIFPAGSISANLLQSKIYSPSRTITIQNIFGPSSANEMMISANQSFSGATWVPVGTSYNLMMPANASSCGPQNVYLKMRNNEGIESSTISGPFEIACWDEAKYFTNFNIGNNARWTGHEFIKWGKLGSDLRFYDLVSDQWIQLNSTGAPSLSGDYSLFRSGNFILLWFNNSSTNYRYDMGNATWSVVPSSGLQSRSGVSVTWSGNEMIVWGGYTSSPRVNTTCRGPDGVLSSGFTPYTHYNDGKIYNPSTNTWSIISTSGSPPSPRIAGGTIANDDHLIVMSGSRQSSDCVTPSNLNDAYLYTFATSSWSSINVNKPDFVEGATTLRTANGLLVCGGAIPGAYPHFQTLDKSNSKIFSDGLWNSSNCLSAHTGRGSRLAYDWGTNAHVVIPPSSTTSDWSYFDLDTSETIVIPKIGAPNGIIKIYSTNGQVFAETTDNLWVFTPF